MGRSNKGNGLLQGARVYLSGPMDFVASRAAEKKFGWRNRVGEFLEATGVTVFDPWFKPDVRGLHEYGREDAKSGERIKAVWTYRSGRKGAEVRSWCSRMFWETLHIDLRMVDTSDFTISYCPTNIYSVGTPHEIIMATLQHKPVLFVSPPVNFPTLHELRDHLKDDPGARNCWRDWNGKSRSKRTRAASRVCGTSRWWAARTSSTDLALPPIGRSSAGKMISRSTNTSGATNRRGRCCHSWRN